MSAVITALFKGKGSNLMAKNFRPTSGLNIYCKVMEKILFTRLQLRVDSMLINNQHAYGKGKSCNTALFEFAQFIYEGIDKPKGKVGAVFIALSIAFELC